MSTDGVPTLDSAFTFETNANKYSGVGKVVEVGKGVTDISAGDGCMAGQAYHSESCKQEFNR